MLRISWILSACKKAEAVTGRENWRTEALLVMIIIILLYVEWLAGQTTWLVDWNNWSCQPVSLQTPQSSAWVSTKLPHFTPVSPGRPAVGQRLDRTSWWRVERLRSLAGGLSQPPQPHQHTGDRMSYFRPSQTIIHHLRPSYTKAHHHHPKDSTLYHRNCFKTDSILSTYLRI